MNAMFNLSGNHPSSWNCDKLSFSNQHYSPSNNIIKYLIYQVTLLLAGTLSHTCVICLFWYPASDCQFSAIVTWRLTTGKVSVKMCGNLSLQSLRKIADLPRSVCTISEWEHLLKRA